MYKIIDNNSTKEFETYNELVNYLSKFNYRCSKDRNEVFDRVKVSDGDTYYFYSWAYENKQPTGYYNRYIRIVNEDGNNAYDSKLIRDVALWKYVDSIEKNRLDRLYKAKSKNYFCGRFCNLPATSYPEFRNGPWPFIHKHWGGSYYRHPKTTSEKRMTTDTEYSEFNRGTRGKNLPSLWDDKYRDIRNKGWKQQGKNKHQWDNGVNNREKHSHGNGVYMDKHTDKWAVHNDDLGCSCDSED